MSIDDKPMMMQVDHAVGICVMLIGIASGIASWAYSQGDRFGACVEMCRPAKFDDQQNVNGGCLCIGSDKVLRFKKEP